MDGKQIGEILVGAMVVAKHANDWIADRHRKLEFAEFQLGLQTQFARLEARIDKLFAFVIGPDGENGIRGDLRKAERRLDDIERMERGRALTVLDRRSGT